MGFLSLTEIIDQVSMECRNSIAVIDPEHSITYGELITLSDRVACYLQCHPQYKKGELVLVHIGKCAHLPAVLLGILKAGLAYIPLSEFHCDEQIVAIAVDSNAIMLLSDNKETDMTIASELALSFCRLDEVLDTPLDAQIQQPTLQSSDLAYILYTSGSTGKPKGVMIEHGQLAYYSGWFAGQSWGDSAPCLPFTSAVSFAAAVSQIFYSLRRGEVLHVLPEDCLRTPKTLLTWYQQHPNAALYCVPTVWRELLAFIQLTDQNKAEFSLPKVVLLSGEAVPNNLKNESFQLAPELRLYNLYGPTEATANASFCELNPAVPVHLGQAIEGTEILLLDEDKNPVLTGEMGELYIAGEGVARGYLNDVERTKARFCDLVDSKGKTVWAHGSGDLAQVNETGQLQYLGRKDCQLKLHGIRFNAADIEQAICQHQAVDTCIVDIHQGENGIQSVVAYIVKSEMELNEAPSAAVFRHFLSPKVAHSLLPSHFIFLAEFPKLPNGKVDKSHLPKPERIAFTRSTSVQEESLQTPTEKALITIWEQVLECDGLGLLDNVMQLGANSLHLMRAQSLIESQLGYVLSFNDFFDYSSIETLSNKLMSMTKNQRPFKLKRNEASALLSHEQAYFMTLDCFSENTDYQIYFYHEIKGALDTDRLKDSLLRSVKQHPVLLTRINLDKTDYIDAPFSINDICIIEKQVSLAQVEDPRWLQQCAQSVCTDLDSGPLIHFQLLSIEDDHHVLLHTAHHVIFDRESINLWSHQLIEQYQGLEDDQCALLEQKSHYQDYINYQQAFMSRSRDEVLSFWRDQLQHDFGALAYESVHSDKGHFVDRQNLNGQKGDKVQLLGSQQNNDLLRLDYQLGSLVDIEAYAQRQNVTVPMVLLAAFYSALLQTHDSRQACQVGIPVSNRNRAGFSQSLGCFVNMMNFFVEEKSDIPFTDFLAQCRDSFFRRLPYAYLSYGEVVDDYRQAFQSSVIPFLANFNYLTQLPALSVGHSLWQVKEIQPNGVRQGIMLTIEEQQDVLLGYLCFDIKQYSNEKITYFSYLFETIINDAIYS